MPNEERLEAVAERLLDATRRRVVQWTPSGEDRFQLSLPSGAVSVEKGRTGLMAMHVYDDSGNYIESLQETQAARPWDDTLRALWADARNSALNIDQVIDSILRDVDSAGKPPQDDDIPF